ncbi:MAG: phosphatidylglycerophosphatase A [candidate division WOR-3 bacterium]|nr:phosphatidylglycerophosphatase A [candidate division WOR-3 bacterium]
MLTASNKQLTFGQWLCIIIGTVFFSGYFPIAPATFSSLLSVFLVILLSKKIQIYVLVMMGIIILGSLIAGKLEKIWSKDARRITIDECAGIMVTYFYLPGIINDTKHINWLLLAIGFVLFRVFDIVKPLYIKTSERITGGFGIMLDDVISGIYSNIILRIILLIFPALKY